MPRLGWFDDPNCHSTEPVIKAKTPFFSFLKRGVIILSLLTFFLFADIKALDKMSIL
jgi:hypothetical protein